MHKLAILISLLFISTNISAQNASPRVVKFAELEAILSARTDTIYVVNFWATWCAPCVKELPYFEEAKTEFADKKVRILLVNLDFKKELESRVIPFLQKKKLQNEVWFLDESDPNSFIDKVSPQWSGAIPFTVIYNGKTGEKGIYESSLTKTQIIGNINKELNNIK